MKDAEKYFEDAMDREKFPNCIECSDDYLARKLSNYFHKEGCSRGVGNWEEISKRINERIKMLKDEDKNKSKKKIKCRDCNNTADGMGWIRYHNSEIIIDSFPLCEIHSDMRQDGTRDMGFLCGKSNLTKNQIQRKLKELNI